MDTLEKKIRGLPPDMRKKVEDFVERLIVGDHEDEQPIQFKLDCAER